MVQAAREEIWRRIRGIPEGRIGKTAELCGLTRQQFQRWKADKGSINPSLENLLGLSCGLRVSVEDLLGLRAETQSAIAGADALMRRVDEISAATQELRDDLAVLRPTPRR